MYIANVLICLTSCLSLLCIFMSYKYFYKQEMEGIVSRVSTISTYSVMQSDRNSLCGDVVLVSVKVMNEDNILDQMYEKQTCFDF